MDDEVNDAVRKEFDGNSGNNDKIPLPTFHQTIHVGRMELLTKRLSDEFYFKQLLEDIDHVFGLDNASQDSLESNDVDFDYVDLEQGMDGLDFEQEMDELLF
ncbi:hypothetical protein Tco_1176024 [Tanacetum coccineum]